MMVLQREEWRQQQVDDSSDDQELAEDKEGGGSGFAPVSSTQSRRRARRQGAIPTKAFGWGYLFHVHDVVRTGIAGEDNLVVERDGNGQFANF